MAIPQLKLSRSGEPSRTHAWGVKGRATATRSHDRSRPTGRGEVVSTSSTVGRTIASNRCPPRAAPSRRPRARADRPIRHFSWPAWPCGSISFPPARFANSPLPQRWVAGDRSRLNLRVQCRAGFIPPLYPRTLKPPISENGGINPALLSESAAFPGTLAACFNQYAVKFRNVAR